jgi:type I restriction enzyme S subunit
MTVTPEVRLGGIVDALVVKRPGSPMPYIALEHIESGVGRLAVEAEIEERDPADSARFGAGDTLFGKLRPYLHKVFQPDFTGCCSTELLVLKPRPGLHERFLYYLALSSPFVAWADGTSYGTKMPRTSWELLRRFCVSLPTINRQRTIADFLDRETGRLDQLMAKKRRLVELLEEKRTALISHAVTKGLAPTAPMKDSGIPWLGEIPAHWDVAPMKHYVQCLDSRRIPLNATERQHDPGPGPYPYYGANSIVDWINGYLFDETLVLLGEDGAPFFDLTKPVSWVVKGKCWVNNHAHVLRPVAIEPRFLAEALNFADYSQFIYGSTRDKLTQEMMKRITIPVPPANEQALIGEYLEVKMLTIETLNNKLNTQLDKLIEHRQALISTAVTGQLDVTEKMPELEEAFG